MRIVVAGIALAVALVQAQPPVEDLLLPETRHITGIVVDSEGKPIPSARIDHSNNRNLHETDAAGKFELDTLAPILVVRKPGYRSELVHTRDATGIQITLQRSSGRTLSSCPPDKSYVGIDGWDASFRFLRVSDVHATPQSQDIDYGYRYYYLGITRGPKGIGHGSGPMWSFGMPTDQNVWRSVKYEEATADFYGSMVIDARGQLPNGLWWRYLGKFGESASYRDVDESTAKALDKFLDSACLRAPVRIK